MNDQTNELHHKDEVHPIERWCRMVVNLREARRQAPIMLDVARIRDDAARDAAAEAYVLAAEAVVTDLGELLEAGILEEAAGYIVLMQPDLCDEFEAWAMKDPTATVEQWWGERTPA